MMTTDWIALGYAPQGEVTLFNNKEWVEKYQDKVLLAWFNQLKRTFIGFSDRIYIKQDFPKNDYFIVVTFDNEVQFEQAKEIADNIPYCWDDQAKEELGKVYFKETREIYCRNTKSNN